MPLEEAPTRRSPGRRMGDAVSVFDFSILALMRAGDAAGALRVADSALALAPKSARLHTDKAQVLLQRGDARAAEESIRRAIELRPTPAMYGMLSRTLAGQGRLDDAVEASRTGLQQWPEAVGLHRQLAALLLRQGDLEGAEASASEALRLAPDQEATQKLLERVRQRRDRPA